MNSTSHTESRESQAEIHGTGDKIPNAMGPRKLMEVLGYDAQSTFYQHQREGRFDRFLLPRPIGLKRYSGRLVEKYLSGRK